MKCVNCKREILAGDIYYNRNSDPNKGKKYCEYCDFGGKGKVRVIEPRKAYREEK